MPVPVGLFFPKAIAIYHFISVIDCWEKLIEYISVYVEYKMSEGQVGWIWVFTVNGALQVVLEQLKVSLLK